MLATTPFSFINIYLALKTSRNNAVVDLSESKNSEKRVIKKSKISNFLFLETSVFTNRRCFFRKADSHIFKKMKDVFYLSLVQFFYDLLTRTQKYIKPPPKLHDTDHAPNVADIVTRFIDLITKNFYKSKKPSEWTRSYYC